MTRTSTALFVALLLIFAPRIASALITGEEGNKKLAVKGMPKGADAIINRRDRVAWWEGEGEFHAEGRGDAKVLNQILSDFAKLDAKSKRIVVHDGVGQSQIIDPDQQKGKRKKSQIDWDFSIWPTGKWQRIFVRQLLQIPKDAPEPPPQIDVYTANLRWADVVVPEGIEVVDQRLEAHGFTPADGIVLEGTVIDLQSKQPVQATVRAQRIEVKDEKWVSTNFAESTADAAGHWVLKNLAPGSARIVAEADGYASRVIGYVIFDDQPRWQSFDSGLLRAVTVSGRVTDQSDKPLAGVDVSFYQVVVDGGGEYELPSDRELKTDVEGRFSANQLPKGKAVIGLKKPGYSMVGKRDSVAMPVSDIELQMTQAGSIRVKVDFNGKKRPKEYMVELEPEGGKAVGKFNGLVTLDETNSYVFKDVPPGKYVVKGHPNPTPESQVSDPIAIELTGDKSADVIIKAK